MEERENKMIHIAEAYEEDLKTIARLEQWLFSDGWTLEGIRQTFQEQNAVVLVAKEEAVLGYCIIYCVLDEAELVKIAVDRAARRQGIAHLLLQKVEEICRDKEISKLMLEMRMSNESACMLYKKHGFEVDGIRKGFYRTPKEDAVLMSKRISSKLGKSFH